MRKKEVAAYCQRDSRLAVVCWITVGVKFAFYVLLSVGTVAEDAENVRSTYEFF